MYEMFKWLLAIVVVILGIIMVAAPKTCTRKDLCDDEAQVAKVRKNGIIIICCGLAVIVVYAILAWL